MNFKLISEISVLKEIASAVAGVMCFKLRKAGIVR